MKRFHEILPGSSPRRSSQHPCCSLGELQARDRNEEQPWVIDPARQLLNPSLRSETTFLSHIIHQHLHEQLWFTPVYRKPVSTSKPKSFFVPTLVSDFPVCRSVRSSESCWLHTSTHLKSLAWRRQLRHHFLKPFQAHYPKKPLIATINLVLFHQVASKSSVFGDQRDHKHRD